MFRPPLALAAILTVVAGSLTASGAQPSERLLPPTTKGFLSVLDVDQLRERWEETQLGQMFNDPVMAPFVEDARRQIRTKLSRTDRQLGISWEDLEGVYGGEVCIAVIQPWDAEAEEEKAAEAVQKDVAAAKSRGESEEQIAAIRTSSQKSAAAESERRRRAQRGLVLLVDVSGHAEAAEELLDKVASNLQQRGAQSKKITIAGASAQLHVLPAENDQQRRIVYCIQDDQLIATDNESVAEDVLRRIAGSDETQSLADAPAFSTAMERGADILAGAEPHIRWFVEPFGYVEVTRAYEGGRRRRGTDLLQVLANQGFDAVQGLGGQIVLSTADHEILHRSFIYAPAVEHPADSVNKTKYRLAANMLDFVNKPTHRPEDWVPPALSGYLTFNWRMKRAFEYVGTLVDEIAADEVFEDVLRSIEADPNGPQINIRKELIDHLAERVTVVSDYKEPITTKSERLLFAVEVTDSVAVVKAVNKAMESDPHARRREHGEHVVWEILNEPPVEVETVQIEGAGFGFEFEPTEVVPEENDKPLIPNAAVTVAYGQLLVANNIDYMFEVLDLPAADSQRVHTMDDYLQVGQALEKLGLDEAAFRLFTRTDQAYRPTYELTRQGKMPESETLLGKLLNQIWQPDEEGQLRRQYLDGTKMPEFAEVEKYLGPAGVFVRSEEDGWSIVGCLLEK